MMRSVFGKTLYDKRFFILGWSLGMVFLAVLMVCFFPAMRQDNGLDAFAANMPEALRGIIGDLANLKNFDTYLASQLFDIRASLVLGIMVIVLGVGLSTRDEESGELRTILAQPVGRTKLVVQTWLALVLIVAIVLAALVAGVYAVAPFIDGASLALGDAAKLALMTLLVMLTFGTVTYAVGIATGKRSVASLVGVIAIVGSFILSTFAAAVDWLKDFEKLSILHYFPAVDIVKSGIELRDVAVLGVITALFLLAGWLIFRGRDLG